MSNETEYHRVASMDDESLLRLHDKRMIARDGHGQHTRDEIILRMRYMSIWGKLVGKLQGETIPEVCSLLEQIVAIPDKSEGWEKDAVLAVKLAGRALRLLEGSGK